MDKSRKPALIGDADPHRFNWLASLLDREFGTRAVCARTFDELQMHVEESNDARKKTPKKENDWSIIIITDDLPLRYTVHPNEHGIKQYFTTLQTLDKWMDFNTILITTQEFKIDWRAGDPPDLTISISPKLKARDGKTFVKTLNGFAGFERLASVENKLSWDKNNRILRRQIRALSDRRNVEDGQSHLARLISMCLGGNLKNVEVLQIGQGKSGASVFRLRVRRKSATTAKIGEREFVLKTCPAGELWKLTAEVQNHLLASPELGHPGYRSHLPKLEEADLPCDLTIQTNPSLNNEYIVRSGQWYAVHFEFLGGEGLGEFVALEDVIIGEGQMLRSKIHTAGSDLAAGVDDIAAIRTRVVRMLLEWLSENWYTNVQAGNVTRVTMVPWDLGNAKKQEYEVMPPYKLTERAKGWIQNFLDSEEAELGARFFPMWPQHIEKVSKLVGEDEPAGPPPGQLGRPLTVLLSHVHGDLNASNLLLWLKHKHPFLIDLPFFQEAGHALQDFARLEIELKFTLLDRQRDSPENKLKVSEYTYSQIPLWRKMEDRLLEAWDQPAGSWPSRHYNENVKLTFDLVQLLRQKARDVQQNVECDGPPPSDFLSEYWPALLYHTVRAIGYPSLSLFKRWLAVYSAGSILSKLGCFDDS